MSADTTEAEGIDRRSLAASLAPVLHEVCDGRLSDINWFRADWQRGGAATGYCSYRSDDGERPAVVKLPVVRRELTWTQRLQSDADDAVVPRLFASGDTLGGYDLAWLVMERFPAGPLGLKWHEDHVERMADAAARFVSSASAFEVDQPPRREAWDELVRGAEKSVKLNELHDEKRWLAALRDLRKRLDPIVDAWRARPVDEWLHGDLHLANAMTRCTLESGPVTLIDLAEVHAGHWVEDAVFLERRFWSRPEKLRPLNPVKAIAAARRRLGLPVEQEDSRLATIRRLLLAATAPMYLKTEGTPKHLAACLEWIERGLDEV